MASGLCVSYALISSSGGTFMPKLTTSYPLFLNMISTRFFPMS